LVTAVGAEISDDFIGAGVQLDEVAALLRRHAVQREVVNASQTGDQLPAISGESNFRFMQTRLGLQMFQIDLIIVVFPLQ
jgi:hypothetical protein